MSLSVSVIVPAHNAAATLVQTLASLRDQTFPDWEAIVVENGSTDATEAVAREFAQHEPRVRVTRSDATGVSAARNHGLALARHDWILFLDADDWIVPTHLARLTAAAAANPALDAVNCGWCRVTDSGAILSEGYAPPDEDLFATAARTCPFTIHACITRRTLVLQVGGFDSTLRTCEDWDLWLRLARVGARYGHVHEILSCYRARPHSASMNGRQLLLDGCRVMARAFAPDPRLPDPAGRVAPGGSAALASVRLDTLVWFAGIVLGSGGDAVPLFSAIEHDPPVDTSAAGCAESLVAAILIPLARPIEDWAAVYPRVAFELERFLHALEARTHQRGLARAIEVAMECKAVREHKSLAPITVGRTHAMTLEATAPFFDVAVPATVERVYCRVLLENELIGAVELPVCDGLVTTDILLDAVAAEFAWPVLGRFFTHTVYSRLAVERDAAGWTVRAGARVLAAAVPGHERIDWSAAHDRIGWPVFLQEAWGLRAPPEDAFYVVQDADHGPDRIPPAATPEWLVVELADPLADRSLAQSYADAVLTVGGVPVVHTALRVPGRRLSAATLRAALTIEGGVELCRACVREGLLQQPLDGPLGLRDRLAIAAVKRQAHASPSARLSGADFMPGAASVLPASTYTREGVVLWPRRPLAPCGTSASRRAALPRVLYPDLQRLAASGHETLFWPASSLAFPHRVIYAPELLWRLPASRPQPAPRPAPADESAGVPPHDFEELFTRQEDPWAYTTPYEQIKYEQTLALLPRRRFRDAIELGCAEGHFTVQLAPRVARLVAADISRLALERARRRSEAFRHVDYRQLDLARDALPADAFDLIVCSELLYYMGSLASLRRVAAKLSRALRPGGVLATAHAHLQVDDPQQPGFDWDLPYGAKVIGETLSATPGLRLARELHTPLYRVQLFEKPRRWQRWWRRAPRIRSIPQPAPLRPEAAAHFRWEPLFRPPAPSAHATAETSRLPILMYHRIVEDGPDALRAFRVTPADFEAQLRFLKENGYRSATLAEWREARERKAPLPGRRVVLTFDDATVDFQATAWPLLRRYGFEALVFLPTKDVGSRCNWDTRHGEPAPILGWDALKALRDEGVVFGSHTVTHPLLTSLSPAEMAQEALRSRVEIEDRLGTPVTTLAYPYGDHDRVVEAVVGSCGYLFGLGTQQCGVEWRHSLLALPRLAVAGGISLAQFDALLRT